MSQKITSFITYNIVFLLSVAVHSCFAYAHSIVCWAEFIPHNHTMYTRRRRRQWRHRRAAAAAMRAPSVCEWYWQTSRLLMCFIWLRGVGRLAKRISRMNFGVKDSVSLNAFTRIKSANDGFAAQAHNGRKPKPFNLICMCVHRRVTMNEKCRKSK